MSPPKKPIDVAANLGGVRFRGELISLPAAGKGHDTSVVEDGFVAIADGSTPLLPSEPIDAHAYACAVLERLRRHRSRDPEEMFRLALAAIDPPHESLAHRPSSTAITLTAIDRDLIATVLGDCLGVIRHSSGRCTVVWDRQLERFDGPVAEQMARDVAGGMSLHDARESATPQLLANRDQANREGTYWLFADDPAAAAHVTAIRIQLDQVEEVFLCSDGFTRLIEPFEIALDAEDLLLRAIGGGLSALGTELRAAEEAPDSFTRFPRLDISDDATAIWLKRD